WVGRGPSGRKTIPRGLPAAALTNSDAALRSETTPLRYNPGRQVVPTVRVRSARAEARLRWIVEAVSTSPPCTAIEVAARSRADTTGATRRRSVKPMFLRARATDPILPDCIGRQRTNAIRPARFMARALKLARDLGLGKVTPERTFVGQRLSTSLML